jgi:UPF0716 protein FxsA
MRFLFLIWIFSIPVLDIISLVEVGARIGVWLTLSAVLLAAVAGSLLVRTQGVAILQEARTTLASGQFPARQVFDGACVLIGGALLVLPGFFSDLLGVMLLAPPVRSLLARLISRHVQQTANLGVWRVSGTSGRTPSARDQVIEGEYETIEPTNPGQEAHGHRPPARSGDDTRATTGAEQPPSPWRRHP